MDSYFTEVRDIDGFLHNNNGPASILRCGCKLWYQYGLMHRADGPAIDLVCSFFHDKKRFFLYGTEINYFDFSIQTNHIVCSYCHGFCNQCCF